MQVALRWAGDANIAIAIELPAGGEATRMVPKISDLHIQAVGRVMLAPLVGEIPGFGAAVIALRYWVHSEQSFVPFISVDSALAKDDRTSFVMMFWLASPRQST